MALPSETAAACACVADVYAARTEEFDVDQATDVSGKLSEEWGIALGISFGELHVECRVVVCFTDERKVVLIQEERDKGVRVGREEFLL